MEGIVSSLRCGRVRASAFACLLLVSLGTVSANDVSTDPLGGVAVDRWVAAAGGIDAGACSDQNNPCATIAYAISQAGIGETIYIAAGDYTDPLTITSDGLRLVGQDVNDRPVIKRNSGPTNQPLLIINGAMNVEVLNLEFDMNQTYVAEGILASGFVDGLTITGNLFDARRSNLLVNSSYGFRNAIAINYTNNSQGLPRVNGSTVTISDNIIDGVTSVLLGSFLRSGIQMDGGNGSITNNTVTAGVQDIQVRYATVTQDSSSDSLTIDGNTTLGRGLEISVPDASTVQITVNNNNINAIAGINGVTVYAADWSLVRLMGNPQNVATTVSNNTFSGHRGSYRGVLVENYPGVLLTDNIFSPAAIALDFVSLVVSNKALNTNTPADAPLTIAVTATGNTFNGSNIAGVGTAVEFLNDNDAGGTAVFGSVVFGGAGLNEPNNFDSNLRWYFYLDDHNCDTVAAPVCGFLDYVGAIGAALGTNTEVRPFAGNINAANNLFDGVAATPALVNSLLLHTFDAVINPLLGIVDYGLGVDLPVVYVDDDWLAGSHNYGDPLPFSSAAAGSTMAFWEIDAFATIPDGMMSVAAGGTVYLAKGNYADSVTFTKELELIGDGNGPGDTVIQNAVTISVGGASQATPLLLKSLRISNPSGDGLRVNTADHLFFDGIALTGNSNEGLDFYAVSDDVLIQNSIFDGNGGQGLRTASSASVSNLTITGSTFSNNLSGIVLFGGSGSGAGQVTNWAISGSQFLYNENTDTSNWGAGISLKTAGAGSVIDGFTITGSHFADNGSLKPLNQVGITVRARPDTTMVNVVICDNSFEETATLGTQLTGINVFDDTANNGYSPIEVCASNTFSGLGHSVSGLEQHDNRGSQPVVNISGGSIANTEFINAPVTRVRDGILFPTITLAMDDAGTISGDTILLGGGVYQENVSVSHDNMTLTGSGTASSVIDGGDIATPGISLPSGRVGTTISNLAVQNVHQSCIYAASGNNNTTIDATLLSNCRADLGGANGGGVYMNGPVDSVTFSNNEVTTSAARGFVIWNGYKSNISITNNMVHDLTGCCGIELQDGTASGVTVTGNMVENAGDSGMAFTQLTSGAGANLIANNVIINTGRFGIEIKNPNGTGLNSGDGSIVISGNTVTRPANPTSTDQRDVSGIGVFRRAYVGSVGETDITTGVVVRDNIVSGWLPASGSPNDGFGIVVEGSNSRVFDNNVTGNDIGIQLQAGNDGYPGDSDQNATNDFFSRGNTVETCVDLGSNTLSGNAIDSRNVSNPVGQNLAASVHNSTRGTYFCSIQAAIDDATTQNGDTIAVAAGEYPEEVVINKGVILQGPFAGVSGFDPARNGTGEAVITSAISPNNDQAVRINADGVTFDGFTIQNVNGTAISSGANYGGGSDSVAVVNNRVLDVHVDSALFTNGPIGTVSNWMVANNLIRNVESSIGSGINLWKVNGATIINNHVEDSAYAGIQLNNASDVEVSGNTVIYTANAGIQVALSSNVQVFGNAITAANSSGAADKAGLTVYGGSSNVTMMCNSVTGTGGNGFSTASSITDPFSGIRVFANAITVPDDISHNLAQSLVIGSNWYGGASATVSGGNGAGVQVADPLASTPIGSSICNNPDPLTANAPVQIVAYAGGGQNATINEAFVNDLQARVVDALGGAVMNQTVSFTAPASNASAVLSSAGGSSDYNGVVSTTATANGMAGSYAVLAASGSLTPDASFALSNDQAVINITLDLGTLNKTYDGQAHVVIATTSIPGIDYSVTYDGGAVAPTDVGNYAVVATITAANYSGTVSGTLVIEPAEVTLSLADLSQEFDGTPKSVTVTTTPAGVSHTVTYDGSATLPSAIGIYDVVVTVTDPNYVSDPALGELHIFNGENFIFRDSFE